MAERLAALSAGGRELLDTAAADVVEEVMRDLYRLHPEWEARYGARGRDFCREDLFYHIEYLAACLDTGSGEPFREYARWLASVLAGRGIPAPHLSESFTLLAEAWSLRLAPEDRGPVTAVLRGGVEALSRTDPYRPSFYRHLPEAQPSAGSLAAALVAGNRPAAREVVLGRVQGGDRLVDVGVGVVQPAMYEVGDLWQASRVSIAQEHLATAITQTLLAQAFALSDFAPPTGRRALFACVEGNHHALGVRMVSDAFEVAGWEVQLLGADTPSQSLVRQVDLFRPELVGLSVSMPQQVAVVKRVIRELRGELGGRRPAIMVGGLALNQLDDLWRGLDADLWTPNAKAALDEVK
jgi:methanogenic corrinoid protein MtbC1